MWIGHFEWSHGEWDCHLFNKCSETISLVILGILLGFNTGLLFLKLPVYPFCGGPVFLSSNYWPVDNCMKLWTLQIAFCFYCQELQAKPP